MDNPQLENGYIRIATELWEALCRIRIPGEARQILDFIIRKTYGFQKRSDRISLSQFVEGTGIDKPHVIRGLRKLESMNMIASNKDEAVAQKGNANVVSYSLNKAYTEWRPLPKKATLPKKAITVAQKGNPSLPKKAPTKDNTTKDNTKDIMSDVSDTPKHYPDDVCQLSSLLKKLILENKANRKLSGNWDDLTRKAIDRMIRIDKRSPDQIRKVIEFSQADDFWWKNILSGDKLRKQFERLEDQVDDPRRKQKPKTIEIKL